jgi:hypothetical protein
LTLSGTATPGAMGVVILYCSTEAVDIAQPPDNMAAHTSDSAVLNSARFILWFPFVPCCLVDGIVSLVNSQTNRFISELAGYSFSR